MKLTPSVARYIALERSESISHTKCISHLRQQIYRYERSEYNVILISPYGERYITLRRCDIPLAWNDIRLTACDMFAYANVK